MCFTASFVLLGCCIISKHTHHTVFLLTGGACLQITIPGASPTTIQAYLSQNYGYEYSFIGPVVGILLGFTIFFAGLAIVVLMTMNYQKR